MRVPVSGSRTPRTRAGVRRAAPPVRLAELAPFKPNPGNLRGHAYIPDGLEAQAPLVVVLHGCTQTAADYDQGSGWSKLAERHGFALLFPEQKRENNNLLCFNWFTVGDSQRGMGEAASIRAMIDAMKASHRIDPGRIFITGLSAGGAMASVMLATYPEVFAAGAIIAGVPYGCASDVREAFDCMGGRARAQATELGAKVRRASPHKGPWPRVSIWQGSADHTVAPSNADAIVLQWAHLHGVGPQPSRIDSIEGYPRSSWADEDGAIVIERYDITGMGHGTPLMPGSDEGQSGEARAHMLDAHISSTDRIAAFFGIAPEPAEDHPRRPGAGKKAAPPTRVQGWKMPVAAPPLADDVQAVIAKALNAAPPISANVQNVIDDALKAAGLKR